MRGPDIEIEEIAGDPGDPVPPTPRHRLGPVLVIAAGVLVVLVLTLTRHPHPQAVPTPVPTPSPSPTPNLEYLYAIPATDLRAYLTTCRSGCRTEEVDGAALRAGVAGFAGATPISAAAVSRGGAVVFESVAALADPDVVVHLTYQRSGGVDVPVSDTSDAAGALVVRQTRSGWRLSATLVARDGAPQPDAARTWCATAPLP